MPSMHNPHWQAIEGGWRLEVGLVVTGLGLLLHWLVAGVIMPLRFYSQLLKESLHNCVFWGAFTCNFSCRMGDCKGFALGAYLIFNVAAMLWQVIFTDKDNNSTV